MELDFANRIRAAFYGPALLWLLLSGSAAFGYGPSWLPLVASWAGFFGSVALIVASNIPIVRGAFWIMNTFAKIIDPLPMQMLDMVLHTAKEGDPESIIDAMDKFSWGPKGSGMMWRPLLMHVGDHKGKFLDDAVKAARPMVAVELGAYLGYSTLRIARLLPEGGVVHSVDPSALGHAVQAKLLDFSGLRTRVKTVFDYSGNYLRELAEKKITIDLMFIDHVKELYLPDMQLALSLGLFRKGSVVVADNVVTPGAPDYREWILKQKSWKTEIHKTFVEYSTHVPDEVLVSVYEGE
eukprot:TRINITY_DN141_c6_g1_i1.p1 TRINITY_DN141_c6_g1~~TRINITY_DN141_c6_g1_i1.p1  ORF type:complete len:322 (+),score=97.87 TRINITY_DN141_c6_g1_i1:83-967(+)